MSDLRLWSVEVSCSNTRGYRRNVTIYVGASSLVEAIQAALEEFDPSEKPWAVSAGHKGPITKIVDSQKASE